MSDAIASAVARKVSLDAARAALRSGARSDLEAALQSLPTSGQKATRLRGLLEQAIERARSVPTRSLGEGPEANSCTSDGIGYEFSFAETGDIAFFTAKRVGAQVTITINSVHPFGRLLIAEGSWENRAVLALLAAWAHYELDQSDDRRQRVVQDARIDWGRVVRRLLSADPGFRFE